MQRNLVKKCKVCESKINVCFHYGVCTCRACGAFFRYFLFCLIWKNWLKFRHIFHTSSWINNISFKRTREAESNDTSCHPIVTFDAALRALSNDIVLFVQIGVWEL